MGRTYTPREHRPPFVHQYRRVPGEGPVPSKIMLIGERPGEKEALSGRPFVGPAGELLDTLLAAANLDRKAMYITNLVKTFTDYGKPTAQEIAADLPELEDEIKSVRPEIIGLLGTYAVEEVLGLDRAELERTHGVPISRQLWDGLRPVCLPMFHPAAALYTPETMNNVLDDFLRLAQVADGELTVREDKWAGKESYAKVTGERLVRLTSGVDTEGDRLHPWCSTVSTGDGLADLVKPSEGTLTLDGGKVYLHNSLHDLGVLRAMKIRIGEDQFVDTMVLAYQLCIEPQGLKALAYRHCGMEMHSYDELVAEPNKTKALEFLLLLMDREWPAPEPYMVLEKGLPKIKKPHGVGRLVKRALDDLAADKRDKDGNPIDLRDRWGNWDDEVKAPVIEVLGDMPVATLDDVDPEKAEWYANRDADATRRVGPILEQKIKDMGLEESVAVDHAIIPMVDRMQEVGIKLAGPEFWTAIADQCEAQMGRAKYEIYKLTGAEINPGSGDQLAELLYGQLGLSPPKMTDSGGRGSVSAVCLEALLSETPVAQHAMDYNEAQKIRGTYCRPLRKLCQAGDGRAHSTFRITRTTTGRLSMADPPLHQIPIMTDLGRQLRDGFIAEPGWVLGDWDLDQIEMRLMAHESRDPELCRLFNEGRDIHAETACKIFSVPMSALSVGLTGKVDDLRRIVAKHAAFGIINGITEHGLVNYMILNRCRRPDGEPWTLDDCVLLLESWFGIYKGVKKFQNECVAEAEATGLSRETIGGRIVYLPAVWSPVKKVRETAARMSYVMHTQGGAASLIKKCMAEVWKHVCKYPDFHVDPLLWVHDELLMQVPDDECIKAVVDDTMTNILCNTVKLRVPVKASGGYAQTWLQAH